MILHHRWTTWTTHLISQADMTPAILPLILSDMIAYLQTSPLCGLGCITGP